MARDNSAAARGVIAGRRMRSRDAVARSMAAGRSRRGRGLRRALHGARRRDELHPSSIGAMSPSTPATWPATCSEEAGCDSAMPAAGPPAARRERPAGRRPWVGGRSRRRPRAFHAAFEVRRHELHPPSKLDRQFVGLLFGHPPERPFGRRVRKEGDRRQRHDGNREERERQPGAERHISGTFVIRSARARSKADLRRVVTTLQSDDASRAWLSSRINDAARAIVSVSSVGLQ